MRRALKILEHPSATGEVLSIHSVDFDKYYYYGSTSIAIGDSVYIYGEYSSSQTLGYFTGTHQMPLIFTVTGKVNDYLQLSSSQGIYLLTGLENIFIIKGFKSELLSSLQDDYIKLNYNELTAGAYISDFSTYEFTNSGEPALLEGTGGVLDLRPYYRFKITKGNGTVIYASSRIGSVSSEVYNLPDLNTLFDYTYNNATIEGILVNSRIDITISEGNLDNNIGQFYYNPDKDFNILINTKTILRGLFDNKIFNENDNNKSTANTGLKDYSDNLVKKVYFTFGSNSLNTATPLTMVNYATPFASLTGKASLENYLPRLHTTSRESLNSFNPILYQNAGNSDQVIGYIGIFARQYYTSQIKELYENTFIGITSEVSLILYSKLITTATELSSITFNIRPDGSGFTATNINTTLIKNEKVFNNDLQILWIGESGLMQYYFNCDYSEKILKENSYIVNNKYTQNNHSEKAREITASKNNITQNEMESVSTLLNCSQCFIYSETQRKLFNIKINTNSFTIKEKDEVRYDVNFTFELNAYVKL